MSLTAYELRRVLQYDPSSGSFVWKLTLGTKAIAGKVAGCLCKKANRVSICIWKKSYLAHRLAWLYVHGEWPKNQIDHINGNPSDNRLCNLREANYFENSRNQRTKKSKSGLKGAAWDDSRKKYVATIRVDGGRRINLGRFNNAHDAHVKYCEASKIYHREFSNIGADNDKKD